MNSVAENIKRLRNKNKMTQDKLAEKMHVTRQAVSNWETAKNQPDIGTLEALAAVLGTNLNELVYGNKKEEYPKYQKKNIRSVILVLSVVLLLVVLRLTLIPYLTILNNTFYQYGLELFILDYATIAALSFCVGFGILSVFSLRFDCSVINQKWFLPSSVVALSPMLLILFEYLSKTFLSNRTPMLLCLATLRFSLWLKPLVLLVLPAAAGVFFFLHRNQKQTVEKD